MAIRISPRLPASLEARITRLAREEGVSVVQFFATAAAFLAGYETRRREDGEELDRLSAWSTRAEQRMRAIERRLRIPPPGTDGPSR